MTMAMSINCTVPPPPSEYAPPSIGCGTASPVEMVHQRQRGSRGYALDMCLIDAT